MGSKPASTVAGETAHFGRELCEDFAPRNEGIRPSGKRGANRPRPWAAISESRGPRFAYENRNQWLSGESYANLCRPRAAISESCGPRFAYENRNQWLCRESYANFCRPRAYCSESRGPWSTCVQFCEVTFTTNPKNNFEKNKKSTGQEGVSSV